jgi:predicted permease
VSLLGETAKRSIEYDEVSPEYFSLLGIPIVRGRNFTPQETQSGAEVALVTEWTARHFWPGDDAIGKTLRQMNAKDLRIIGVVKDVQVSHLSRVDGAFMYLPAGPRAQTSLHLLVRGAAAFSSTANDIRSAAHALDPNLLVDVFKLEDNLELWRTPSRIAAVLSGSLGALALLLASIGVYGVVSYAVSRRVREIGIRMTLGADRRQVLGMMLRQAMLPVLLGCAVGMALCAVVSRILSSVLFGVSSHDPFAFVVVPLFLVAVALAASYVPARRATKVDPMTALRHE